MEVLFKQYEMIRDARRILFEYCQSLKPEHLIYNHEAFAGKSIRYLLVHTANTYFYWLGHFAGFDSRGFSEADNFQSIEEVIELYKQTDTLVYDFLEKNKPDYESTITAMVPRGNFDLSLTPLELFTHVITHEYHHKGQILTMSRHLGYTPVDTDIIRFS